MNPGAGSAATVHVRIDTPVFTLGYAGASVSFCLSRTRGESQSARGQRNGDQTGLGTVKHVNSPLVADASDATSVGAGGAGELQNFGVGRGGGAEALSAGMRVHFCGREGLERKGTVKGFEFNVLY